jgi:hypothetical protein
MDTNGWFLEVRSSSLLELSFSQRLSIKAVTSCRTIEITVFKTGFWLFPPWDRPFRSDNATRCTGLAFPSELEVYAF